MTCMSTVDNFQVKILSQPIKLSFFNLFFISKNTVIDLDLYTKSEWQKRENEYEFSSTLADGDCKDHQWQAAYRPQFKEPWINIPEN